MEIAKHFKQNGFETTHIEWFKSWTYDELMEALLLWFSESDSKQVIAISTSFGLNAVFDIRTALEDIKKIFPNVKIIVGGNRGNNPRVHEFIDYYFIGRSVEMLNSWLKGESMQQYATSHPNVFLNHNVNILIEEPVIPEISDDDILGPHDQLGFELGVGCRFDCSFCSYDLRGIKDPKLAEVEKIRHLMQNAYNKYGVKTFYLADDTVNEHDHKLEILAEAVEQLTFTPNLAGFFRLDLLEARPQQYELLRRCKISAMTFGIETFHPMAAKLIKKSTRTDMLITALEKLKTVLPDTFLASGFLIGLTYDNKESIWKHVKLIIDRTLLHSPAFYDLHIGKPLDNVYDESYLSDISKYPEKYGYTVSDPNEKVAYNTDEKTGTNVALYWENDWTNSSEARKLAYDLWEYCHKKGWPQGTAFEWNTLLSFGIVKSAADFKVAGLASAWGRADKKVKQHKRNYVEKKLNYLKEKQMESQGVKV